MIPPAAIAYGVIYTMYTVPLIVKKTCTNVMGAILLAAITTGIATLLFGALREYVFTGMDDGSVIWSFVGALLVADLFQIFAGAYFCQPHPFSRV